jgi:hypothetical protein
MEIQEYDLRIEHISGVNNFFADSVSRNPFGLVKESRDLRKKHQEIVVAKINFEVDKTLLKELGSLSRHQLSDPVLNKTRENYEKDPGNYKERYMIRNDVLFCRNDTTHPYWRVMLPRNLEYRVIKHVHT